ncbi:GGDEF domain-containing protein [Algisphaera agarilytica]|uniref:diguanylate cyclase n=1 Tax=Algisphaera agarilytica TaxID=1385975 RepID=A0A7X0H395_9BACT|nr:GGDEF domain-containing protein [Algisphaera agarilytica]MBB6428404.1 diguanylate cyclase (GGDEF)-like protein [Algisphaera agarilytica]
MFLDPLAAPNPIVVVGNPELADQIQTLVDAALASDPQSPKPLPEKVLRVPSFLSALGEAARTDLAAVLGPVRALSGMAASTAESLRKLAPHARLILIQPAASGHPHARAEDEDARLALEAGFDYALPSDPELSVLAQALDLPVPASETREPALRRADPHDLSTLDLGPATPTADRSNQRPGTAALQEAINPPSYQATLDAALPPDMQDPPPVTPITSQPSDQSGDASLGDTDLVNLILRGEGGMKSTALAMIRAQSGLSDVNFYPANQVPEGFANSSAPVAQCDQTFGCLTSSDPDAGPQLTVWADWLVHWLRLEAQFNRLRDLAMKDELTGVWNRRYFNHFLKKILDRAAAGRQQVTLLLFDIDDFKLYNDAYGHAAGDEILVGVANLMKSSVREHDVVARIGGDEFAVIFWDAGEEPRKAHSKHPDDVLNAAKRFQKAVCDHRFPKLLDKAHGTLTISGGLAGFPWDGRTPEDLLEAADTMAMQSKQQGKNAITFGPGAQVDPDKNG